MQVLGQGIHAGQARRVVVRPQQHVTPGQRGEVRFLPRVGTVGPAGRNVVGQQLGGSVRGLLALAEHHRIGGAPGQLIEAQQRASRSQPLPAPLQGAVAAALAPGQRRELFARLAAVIRRQVEATEHHQRPAIGVSVDPQLRRFAVAVVLGRALAHGLIRDRQQRHPLRRLGLAGGRRGAGTARRHVEEVRQLVAGVHFRAAVQVVHQVNQVAAFVTRGEIRPSAFGQVHLERSGMFVGAPRVGCGVFLAAIRGLTAWQPAC
ncbi:hypothetical protein D3C85_1174440 [compost metagenome]